MEGDKQTINKLHLAFSIVFIIATYLFLFMKIVFL